MHTATTIVTAGIIRKESAVLLTKRLSSGRHPGKWEFPGGKLEDGESPVDCLRRELLEELGLDVQVGGIYEVLHHNYEFGPILLLAYECTPLSATIRNLQVAEHRFVPLDQLNQRRRFRNVLFVHRYTPSSDRVFRTHNDKASRILARCFRTAFGVRSTLSAYALIVEPSR